MFDYDSILITTIRERSRKPSSTPLHNKTILYRGYLKEQLIIFSDENQHNGKWWEYYLRQLPSPWLDDIQQLRQLQFVLGS